MTVLCSEYIDAGSFYKVKQPELGLKLWTKGICMWSGDQGEWQQRASREKSKN